MNKERYIKELVTRVFEKAKKVSSKDSPYGLCKYLNEEAEINVSERNLNRYYDCYVAKKSGKNIRPDRASLDLLAQYLNSENFKAFVKELEESETDNLLKNKVQKLKNLLSLSLICIILLSIVLAFYVVGSFEKNCMVWVNDHYEAVKCSGSANERKRDNVILLNLKKIKNPLACLRNMWYDKSDNKVSFFTYHGKHPENGKILKPVTEYICEKYILEKRDSILVNKGTDSIPSNQ